jgi:hypothetical protein
MGEAFDAHTDRQSILLTITDDFLVDWQKKEPRILLLVITPTVIYT